MRFGIIQTDSLSAFWRSLRTLRPRNRLEHPEARSYSSLGTRWRNVLALALGLFGLTAMVGDLGGFRSLKGLGMLSTAAPCPKVFCNLGGYEGFACSFAIHYETAQGEPRVTVLTPELYARLAGPYNRRNVYGAALAGAPVLPEALWRSIFRYGLNPNGPLRRELGVPADAKNLSVRIQTRARGPEPQQTWTLRLE